MFGGLHGGMYGSLFGAPLDELGVYLELLGPGRIDHVASALKRLPAQFIDKPKIAAMLSALVRPAQTLEAVLYQLTTQQDLLAGAVGARLDNIGRIVGQPRAGLADDVYRVYLRARIAANRSHGTVPHILRVLRLLLLGREATIELTNLGNAAIEVRVLGLDVDDTLAQILADFLRVTVAAGVRAVLVSGDVAGDTFQFGDYMFLTGSLTAGDVSFTALSNQTGQLARYPATGTLRIGSPGSASELVDYTERMPDPDEPRFVAFVLSAPCALTHTPGTTIGITATDEPGWGTSFDSGQPALTRYANAGFIGGRLANART